MDNASLERVLTEYKDQRFWLKPVGLALLPIVINGIERESFPEAELEVHFPRDDKTVGDGDVLIAYRVGVAAIMYVVERLPKSEWTTPLYDRSQESVAHYPYLFKARNLTPEFAVHWRDFPIKPFTLAKHTPVPPDCDPVRLGRLNYSDDRARIPFCFAEMLLRRIQAAVIPEQDSDR